jgi:hypothetical protein
MSLWIRKKGKEKPVLIPVPFIEQSNLSADIQFGKK